MIERYTLPKMARIWLEDHRLEMMLEVELLVCEALARFGKIPKHVPSELRRKVGFHPDRIKELEEKTRHDVVAFVSNLQETAGEAGRFLHLGLTSSDVLDTSLAVLLTEAADLLIWDTKVLLSHIRRKANRYRRTPCIGRTHGIHAEPTTFGLKLAVFYDEMKRGLERLKRARSVIAVGKISGAVGTFATVSPAVERYVCKKLKLTPAPISTQIVARDRHAEFVAQLALVGASLERFATEIRHLQRTEVMEAEEYFHEGQKGSSAMPHKRNPVRSERVCGLARLLRAYTQAACEDVALWHERDISHSSTERVILPDATLALDYMLHEMAEIVRDLVVYPERMQQNLEATGGLIYSQRLLLALIERGLPRREAYDVIQRCALEAFREKRPFQEVLTGDRAVTQHLSPEEIAGALDPADFLKEVDTIFKRVGL